MDEHKILTDELIKLLKGGNAHARFADAIGNLAENLRGVKPVNLPYTIWQLIEHIRITQWDMLEFSKGEEHKSPKWPDDYWVKELAPKNEEEWQMSLKQIENNLEEFISLVKTEDIYKPLTHGNGQNILREALQIADHIAYHIAEIIIIRRLLGAWNR